MNRFKMIGTQNKPQDNVGHGGAKAPELPMKDAARENDGAESPSGGMKPKLKKLWGWILVFLNYLDEEVPDAQPKKRSKFNAFLDSLEEPDPEPVPGGGGDGSGKFLKRAGSICWEIILHGTVIVFLFVLAVLGTIRALDFVRERHVPLYPARDVMQYLKAEHESLEAAADALPAGKDRSDDIPVDRFGEQCAGILKPVRIYSDEYGVYLMTSKSWYVGENGIFIARDKEKMPDDVSWGLIEGRVFAYAFFK
jgi:hypothetical protein